MDNMKKFYAILCLFLPFLLTGCTSYIELNELGIVSAIGIEKENNHYIVSMTLITPEKEQGESAYNTITIKEEGNTIEESMDHVSHKSGKKLMISHLSYLAVDENIVKYSLNEVLNTFLQNEESRNNFPILLCHNLTPSTLLEEVSDVNQLPLLLEWGQKEYATTVSLSLEEIMKMRLKSDVVILPTIKKEENTILSNGLSAIYHQSILKLNEEETKSYLYLTDNIENTKIYTTIEQETIPLSVLENHTTISTSKNHLTIEIDSKIEANTSFSNNQIKLSYEDSIKDMLTNFLEKARYEQIDFFHLSSIIYQNDPHYYEKEKNHLLTTFQYDIKFQTELIEDSQKIKGGDIFGKN